jgi:hypothetical protein
MRLVLLMCLLLAAVGPGRALSAEAKKTDGVKQKAPSATVPAPPPLPAEGKPSAPEAADTGLEPEVTITTRGADVYEEYRLNGRLYKVKVIPAKGKPYYLFDHEGKGQFRRSDLEPAISIPTWVIKEF